MTELRKLTDEELWNEEEYCQRELELLRIDLNSTDSDDIADAVRSIRDMRKYLDRIGKEKKRRERKGVTE